MAGVRETKRRIRSVKNIQQITMALEAVSASRVRRATQLVLATRAYANSAMEVLMHIASGNQGGQAMHPLLTVRPSTGSVCIVLITSDRGLAGAYNSNIIRIGRLFADRMGKSLRWVAVGRKGRDALIRAKENVVAEFTGLPAWMTISDIRPIARVLIDDYLSGTNDETYLAYTDYINQLTQRPRVQRLFPLIPQNLDELGAAPDYMKVMAAPTEATPDYIFEPSAASILEQIVPKFTETVIFQALLEATASEHSARMVAMRNASDSAKDLVTELNLEYNKVRQAAITAEILDIVGGVEALGSSKDSRARDDAKDGAIARNAAQNVRGNAPDMSPVIADPSLQGV